MNPFLFTTPTSDASPVDQQPADDSFLGSAVRTLGPAFDALGNSLGNLAGNQLAALSGRTVVNGATGASPVSSQARVASNTNPGPVQVAASGMLVKVAIGVGIGLLVLYFAVRK